MDDSLLPAAFIAAGTGGVLLWRWLSGVQARARGRIGRAFDGLEEAIRADERRRAEARFAALLAAAPPASPPPRRHLRTRRILDDRVAWEK